MDRQRSALVLGATGLVGSTLVSRLLVDESYSEVKVLVRRPTGWRSDRMKEIVVDLESLPEQLGEISADDLFLAFGTTIRLAGSRERFRRIDLDIPLNVARQALEAGVTQCLLVSAVGADPGSAIFYNRIKGELEEALISMGFDGLHIFRPGLLLGERKEDRPSERIASRVFSAIRRVRPDLLGRWSAMPVPLLAEAMHKAADMGLEGVHLLHYREMAAIARQNLHHG